MLRAHREPPERQLVQQLTNRAFVETNVKALLDPSLQVDTPPAHHAIALEIGACVHPGLDLGLLLRRQTRLGAVAAGLVGQAVQTVRIIAMHPIAKCLAVLRRVIATVIAVSRSG
jgi:hypothetical protein